MSKIICRYNGYAIHDYGIEYLVIMRDDEYDFVQYPFYGIGAAKKGIDLLNAGKPLPEMENQ